MVFGVQKVGFCIAKVWFLFFKRVFFVLQYIVPCPRNTPKWRCVSYHFDISKPFGSDCKTGAMNRPLRLTECSLLYICVINEHCGMFVDIFCITHLLFIATFTHVLPRPPRRRRGRFIVPVPTKFHKMALCIPIVDIAIHHTAPPKHPQNGVAIHRTTPTKHPQNGVALVLFGNIIFTYFWVLPTFLYLTNFAFAK